MGIEIALLAAAAGASAINTRRTAKKQDRALASKIQTQSRKQREADARVNETIDKVGKSSAAGDRAAALSEYVTQLRNNSGQANALGGQPGRTSNAYAQAASDAAMGVSDFTNERAGQMAIQDGAVRQRQGEGRDQVRLGGDLGLIGREAQGLAALDDMRISGIRRNPWLDAAAQVLGGLAGGAGGGKAAGAESAAAAGRAGLGNPAGIGAGLAGGSRFAPRRPAPFDPFAMYGLGR